MNILVLSQKLLTSDVSGMSKRIKLFLKYFKNCGHKITFVAFYEKDNELINIAPETEYYDKIITVKLNRKLAYIRMFKAIFTGKPFKLEFLNTLKMHRTIDKELKLQHYDLLYSFFYKMVPFIEKHHQYKRFIDLNDAFALNYERQIKFSKKWYETFFLKIEKNRIYKYEKYCIDKFDKCIYVSNADKNYMTDNAHIGKTTVIPVVTDTEYFSYNNHTEYNPNEISYIGLMSYIANHDAVMHFINNIYPLIKTKIPNVIFKIIGADPKQELLDVAKKDKSIIVTGRVDDIREYLKKSALSVAPVRIGAGIQNKILEAMSMGIPVVTSELGANPITKDRDILQVAETSQDFAEKICEIMQNKDYRMTLSQKSRQFIVDNYSLERFFTEMNNIFNFT